MLQPRWTSRDVHEEVAVLKGLKSEVDSVKEIGSVEVGIICEQSNVLELDEYAEPRGRKTLKFKRHRMFLIL